MFKVFVKFLFSTCLVKAMSKIMPKLHLHLVKLLGCRVMVHIKSSRVKFGTVCLMYFGCFECMMC